MLKDKAAQYYKQGYSCSESVVMAAIDEGLCDKSLLACATPFSGGMSSGCLCGAVAGAQLVIGYIPAEKTLMAMRLLHENWLHLLLKSLKTEINLPAAKL